MPKLNITFDLAGVNEALKTFILEHQGERRFINTSDSSGCDLINTLVFDNDYSGNAMFMEHVVSAVHVKNGKIEILYGHYDLEDEKIAEMEDNEWTDICDDNIITSYTLLSIAENIEEFVED